jgi:HD-like signal output (HDOD) protein/CheY-like chemotaxis protein
VEQPPQPLRDTAERPKSRVLFVDDEPHVLEGLQRLLRGKRHLWEMAFVSSGEAALESLRDRPFDVVVSDMRMPGMDGSVLLRAVKDEFPQIVRLALSGHADLTDTIRAASVAHQFLSKPCEPEILADAIRRALDLQRIVTDPSLQAAIGRIDLLPSVPRVYAELTRALEEPDVSLNTVVGIVEQDIAMSAKVLQIVNSAFFGVPRSVADLRSAVSVLGMATLRNLALSLGVFQAFGEGSAGRTLALDALQRHGFACGSLARLLLADKRHAEDAFVGGLLHDVGRLVLAGASDSQGESRPKRDGGANGAELDHAQAGAYLLALWGLPSPIVEAVAYHHCPSQGSSEQFGVLGAVHVANALVHELSATAEEGRGIPVEGSVLDAEYLARLGVAGEIDRWRKLAAERLGVAPGSAR